MKLNKLVSAIHNSITSASDEMQKRNLELLDIYFEKGDSSDVKKQLRDALSASISVEGEQKAEELVDKVMSSISPELLNAYSSSKENLIPKTVTIQYPRITAKGPVVHNVIVPLIAIVPISMTELSEVKIKANLEVNIVDDGLEISFPSKQTIEEGQTSNIVSLEMTIHKSLTPSGLQKLIEGYEKVLGAQIPG